MAFTPDKHPLVGPIAELENQYLSVGYSGHGMVRAFSCGRHIAEKITQKPLTCPEIDIVFSPDRFMLPGQATFEQLEEGKSH